MTPAAGLLVSIGGASYFVPAERVGFVVRTREVREGRLVMPRGTLPYVEAAAAAAPRRNAVAIRAGNGFVALGVDTVDLADSQAAARSASTWSALEGILEGGGRDREP